MAIGVGDLSSLSHVVLQVLPRGGGGEVFHDKPVSSSGTRRLAPAIATATISPS